MREAVAHLFRGRGYTRAPLRVQGPGAGEGPLGSACCVVAGRTGATRAPCGNGGDVLYLRVPAESAAALEAWNAGAVRVAPQGLTRRLGPPVEMSARILSPADEGRAKRALAETGCRVGRLRLPRDYVYLELRPPASS